MDTVKYAPPNDIQTSAENGLKNENVDGGSLDGVWNKMEIPVRNKVYKYFWINIENDFQIHNLVLT